MSERNEPQEAPEGSGTGDGLDPDATDALGLTLDQRVLLLERQFVMLRHEHREMLIEWEGMFEKFRNLYARLNRRDQRDEVRASAPANQPINPAAAALLNLGGRE